MKDLEKQIREEFARRLDIIYTKVHGGSYYEEITEMKKDLEQKYDCTIITQCFEISMIKFKKTKNVKLSKDEIGTLLNLVRHEQEWAEETYEKDSCYIKELNNIEYKLIETYKKLI